MLVIFSSFCTKSQRNFRLGRPHSERFTLPRQAHSESSHPRPIILVSCFRTETLLKPTSCLTWNLPPNFRWRAGYTTFSYNRHNLRVLCHNYPQGYDRLERACSVLSLDIKINHNDQSGFVCLCRQWNIAMAASIHT